MVSWDETLEAAGAVVALTPAASSGPSAVSPLAIEGQLSVWDALAAVA